MPLPTRRSDESHQAFLDRCMRDEIMVREFPDAEQRRAVCEQQAKLKGNGYLNFVCEPGAITIEAATDDQGEGRPKLPRFTMVAYTGGPMRIAGWRYPVVVDLAGLAIPSQSRPIRFGHDMASGVGHTDAIKIEDGRLLATGLVSRDTAAAKEIVASARNGFPWQASIGAAVEELEFLKERRGAPTGRCSSITAALRPRKWLTSRPNVRGDRPGARRRISTCLPSLFTILYTIGRG